MVDRCVTAGGNICQPPLPIPGHYCNVLAQMWHFSWPQQETPRGRGKKETSAHAYDFSSDYAVPVPLKWEDAGEEIVPDIQPKHPLAELEAVSSCSGTCCIVSLGLLRGLQT